MCTGWTAYTGKKSLTPVSLASYYSQLGLPAQTTAQEGERKNPKSTGNQTGLQVEKATKSGLNSLPQRQLHPHGVSLEYSRKLGKKELKGKKTPKTKKQKQKDPSHSGQWGNKRFSIILEKSAWLTYKMEVPSFISSHPRCLAGQFTSWLMKIYFYILWFAW